MQLFVSKEWNAKLSIVSYYIISVTRAIFASKNEEESAGAITTVNRMTVRFREISRSPINKHTNTVNTTL